MPELILVRHVETEMAGCFCGQSDPAINATGKAQLPVLINTLRPWKMDCVYTSNLQRARQTAEAIAREFSTVLELRSGLREICFGEWEGLLWSEIELKDAEAADRWMNEYPHGAAPGGEEYGQFSARVSAEAEFLFQRAKDRRIVAVTHAGVMREILMRRCGVSKEVSWNWAKEYGAGVLIDERRHATCISNGYVLQTR
jgi:alpha-ribazole phosphatase/probable phosphoglycerate mutase